MSNKGPIWPILSPNAELHPHPRSLCSCFFFRLVFSGRFHGVNVVPRRRHSLFLLFDAVLKPHAFLFLSSLLFPFSLRWIEYFSFICILPFGVYIAIGLFFLIALLPIHHARKPGPGPGPIVSS